MTMNAIITNQFVRGIVLLMLVLITPLLVFGDVHLAHQSHPCEDERQSSIDELPWHPHGACADDVEQNHFDLKSLIQKGDTVDSFTFVVLCSKTLTHDHDQCHHATTLVDNIPSFTEDLQQVLGIFLI